MFSAFRNIFEIQKRYCCDGTDICFEPEDFSAEDCQPGCECGDGFYRNTLNGKYWSSMEKSLY